MGPSTVWLPTLLKISSFVLKRIKKLILIWNLRLSKWWQNYENSAQNNFCMKILSIFFYMQFVFSDQCVTNDNENAVLLNNSFSLFDMISVRSVLFAVRWGKYLENLSIKKLLLWRHAEVFVGLKRHINSCSFKLKCLSQQILAPNIYLIVNRPLNPASPQSH